MAKFDTTLTGLEVWDYERRQVCKIVYIKVPKSGCGLEHAEVVSLITNRGIQYNTVKENVIPLEMLDEDERKELCPNDTK